MSLRAKLLEVASALLPALRTSTRSRVVSGTAVALSLVAFGAAGVAPMVPDASDLPVTMVIEELAVPDLNAQIASLSPAAGQFIAEERVRPGDNLSALLDRLGVNDLQAASFIRSDAGAHPLLSLRPGRRVQVTTDGDGRLLSASALLGDGHENSRKLVIRRSGDGFTTEQQAAAFDNRVEMRSGEIRSSLFAATDAAQVPDAVASQLVEIFSSDIDFATDLKKGDSFQVVYETVWQDGEMVRTGRVLAAELRNAGKTLQAVWYSRNDEGGYYDLDGRALRKAFLKSPLAFSRVTSGFAMRVHPISGQWKQHKGIDFAAPTGTPIRSTGDGTVEFAGNAGGYGNIVIIRHGSLYTTAYAHMSRIAARRGQRVAQGDVIGYVGSTGWSTGPHLHYEFRVNNVSLDPNRIVVPHAQSLAGVDLQRFRGVAADMEHRFSLMSGPSLQLAAR